MMKWTKQNRLNVIVALAQDVAKCQLPTSENKMTSVAIYHQMRKIEYVATWDFQMLRKNEDQILEGLDLLKIADLTVE